MAIGSLLKTILLPGLISLIAYLLLSYLLLPFVRRYRQRYTQYLPVNSLSPNLSNGTSFLRDRVFGALTTLFFPSSWLQSLQRRNRQVVDGSYGEDGQEGDHCADDELFDDEEGEGMVGFDIDARRREALEQRRSDVGEQDRRLSRELEEGFRDDSDDDDVDIGGGRTAVSRGNGIH